MALPLVQSQSQGLEDRGHSDDWLKIVGLLGRKKASLPSLRA